MTMTEPARVGDLLTDPSAEQRLRRRLDALPDTPRGVEIARNAVRYAAEGSPALAAAYVLCAVQDTRPVTFSCPLCYDAKWVDDGNTSQPCRRCNTKTHELYHSGHWACRQRPDCDDCRRMLGQVDTGRRKGRRWDG